ncbi:MAG: hypothetical protein A4E73_02289 [Syntrophaceae bacterium PtaU1.Bin231]|nr:MAG: hypothetical protein A4E73_02289 [Syntrophaceae bacterium PtaU1.Bin231]
MGAEPVHDGFFESGHGGEFGIDVELEDVAREAVDERLIGGGLRLDAEIGSAFGELHDVGRRGRPAESAVQACEHGGDGREEPLSVVVKGFAFPDHQGALLPLVVVVRQLPLRDEFPRRRDRVVEDQLLLAMQDAGEVDVGGGGHLAQDVEDRGDGEAGDDLQVLFVHVVQFLEAGPHAERVEHDVLPVVVLRERADLSAERVHV